MTGANKTVSGFNLIYLFAKVTLFRSIMDALLRWESEAKLPPMPITTFPFEDVVKAHKAIESGKSVGKLVLVV
jgi:NADPH:quinone reductase-like Zn-dependent oxidoreductase